VGDGGVEIDQGHGGALGSKRLGDGPADAPRPAGYHGRLPCQVQLHDTPSRIPLISYHLNRFLRLSSSIRTLHPSMLRVVCEVGLAGSSAYFGGGGVSSLFIPLPRAS